MDKFSAALVTTLCILLCFFSLLGHSFLLETALDFFAPQKFHLTTLSLQWNSRFYIPLGWLAALGTYFLLLHLKWIKGFTSSLLYMASALLGGLLFFYLRLIYVDTEIDTMIVLPGIESSIALEHIRFEEFTAEGIEIGCLVAGLIFYWRK